MPDQTDSATAKTAKAKLRASPQARHSPLKPVPVTPPVVLLLFAMMIVIGAALAAWVYSVQSRQAQMESRVAEQVTEVLQRVAFSGQSQQASFEQIGLSLKTLDDRVQELTRLSAQVQRKKLSGHDESIGELQAQMLALKEQVEQTSSELVALSGLISTRNAEVSGELAKRLREAGQATGQILQNQQQAKEQLAELQAAAKSLAVYRRTTNQALLRLESRMLLLEKRVEQLEKGETAADDGLSPPRR